MLRENQNQLIHILGKKITEKEIEMVIQLYFSESRQETLRAK